MLGLLVKNKLELIWKESMVQQFEVAFRYFYRTHEQNGDEGVLTARDVTIN
jgi:hypothetical protein